MMNRAEQLDLVFAALADRTRRGILRRLARGSATVKELARPFHISQPAISKHLKILEEARLISTQVDGQKRPRKLELVPLQRASDWIEKYTAMCEQNYTRLDLLLNNMKEKPERTVKKTGARIRS